MAKTANRNYDKVADNEGDKPQGVNDALDQIDADVQGLANQIATLENAGPLVRFTGDITTATQVLHFTDGILTGVDPL